MSAASATSPAVAPRGASLVVPNWNGEALLAANLPSLLEAARRYPGAAELVVVDDGSSDGSVALVEKRFPEARLVVHERNRGFGAACGTGVSASRQPLVVLLNSDVRVAPDFLEPLERAFATDASTFAASPLIFDPDGSPANYTLSVPYLQRGKVRFRERDVALLVTHGSEAPGPWYTFYPAGGAVMLDRARFLELGGFDPLFHPFYYEDLDLAFRAWRRGWCCRVVPESRLVHAAGSTISRAFPRRRVQIVRKRNRLLFLWKNLTSDALLWRSFAHQLGRVVTGLLRLDALPLLATAAALPRLPAALARRREEQRAALYSEAEIFERIERAWQANAEALARARPR